MGKNIILYIILAIVIYFLFVKGKEYFQLSDLVTIQTTENGKPIVYNVTNSQGLELVSSAFTPVMCNNWIITNQSKFLHPLQKGWVLQEVQGAPGVYIFNKPQMNECLYTHYTMNKPDEVRSYLKEGSCIKTSLCGDTSLNYQGELDENSLRTYFRLVKAPQGNYIISVKNNEYLCIDAGKVSFKSSPDASCQFTFNKL
jgi:hypothetical protein